MNTEKSHENVETPRRKDRSEGSTYRDVAQRAVAKEAEVKINSGPAVSTTVVGETVTFTQNFNF